MSDFEKQIHNMFDHIWDCDINHPIFDDTVGELMNAVIQCYNNLPSAEPERHGRWIHIRTESDGNALYECSECHKGEVHVPIVEVHYCWNCGARMEGEGE